jgi:hypothetical protein
MLTFDNYPIPSFHTNQYTTMFEMSKMILQRVSFDKKLFKKELLKAMKWLQPKEKTLLYVWCLANFAMYRDVVLEVFKHTVSKA